MLSKFQKKHILFPQQKLLTEWTLIYWELLYSGSFFSATNSSHALIHPMLFLRTLGTNRLLPNHFLLQKSRKSIKFLLRTFNSRESAVNECWQRQVKTFNKYLQWKKTLEFAIRRQIFLDALPIGAVIWEEKWGGSIFWERDFSEGYFQEEVMQKLS